MNWTGMSSRSEMQSPQEADCTRIVLLPTSYSLPFNCSSFESSARTARIEP